MSEKMNARMIAIVFFGLFPLLIVLFISERILFYRTLSTLKTIKPETVSSFKGYPNVGKPVGNPVVFEIPDSLMNDFFDALTDSRSYWPNHDTGDSGCYVEIIAEDSTLHIGFYIPTRKPNVIVGNLSERTRFGMIDYGFFQSQHLSQWYRKYSHRWLNTHEKTQ